MSKEFNEEEQKEIDKMTLAIKNTNYDAEDSNHTLKGDYGRRYQHYINGGKKYRNKMTHLKPKKKKR